MSHHKRQQAAQPRTRMFGAWALRAPSPTELRNLRLHPQGRRPNGPNHAALSANPPRVRLTIPLRESAFKTHGVSPELRTRDSERNTASPCCRKRVANAWGRLASSLRIPLPTPVSSTQGARPGFVRICPARDPRPLAVPAWGDPSTRPERRSRRPRRLGAPAHEVLGGRGQGPCRRGWLRLHRRLHRPSGALPDSNRRPPVGCLDSFHPVEGRSARVGFGRAGSKHLEHDDDGRWNAGDDEARARILGHQFLWMVLAPDEVFHAFGEPRSDTLDGTAVELDPRAGDQRHPVELAVDAGGRPVALRVERGGSIGTLLIRWSSWKRVQGVHLPFAVEIAQGRDVYRFRFREPALRPPADAGWTPPR